MKLVRTFGRGANRAKALLEALEQRGSSNISKVQATVTNIVTDVRKRGDAALREYSRRFDGLGPDESLLVSREEMQAAWEETAPKLQAAMRIAQANIRAFAEAQKPNEWIHDFTWHGEDGASKTHIIPGAKKFQKLRLIPDQFYYNITDVRTSDDALITVKLMIFFELVNVETMLNNTHDPIADFVRNQEFVLLFNTYF